MHVPRLYITFFLVISAVKSFSFYDHDLFVFQLIKTTEHTIDSTILSCSPSYPQLYTDSTPEPKAYQLQPNEDIEKIYETLDTHWHYFTKDQEEYYQTAYLAPTLFTPIMQPERLYKRMQKAFTFQPKSYQDRCIKNEESVLPILQTTPLKEDTAIKSPDRDQNQIDVATILNPYEQDLKNLGVFEYVYKLVTIIFGIKSFIQTIGTIFETIKQAIVWVGNFICSLFSWILPSDPENFSYDTHVRTNEYKMNAIDSCLHFVALLELATQGTQAEQLLARIHLFNSLYPIKYEKYFQKGLKKLAVHCIDAQGHFFYDPNLTQAVVRNYFSSIYEDVITTPWQVYGKMDEKKSIKELTLDTKGYAQEINNEYNQALIQLLYARLSNNIIAMHDIKEEWSYHTSMTQTYYDLVYSFIQEEQKLENLILTSHDAWWQNLCSSSINLRKTYDIKIVRDLLVEKIWPYLGSSAPEYIKPLYTLLPTDETIFSLIHKKNYRFLIAQQYIEHIIHDHQELLHNNIFLPFTTHPFVIKNKDTIAFFTDLQLIHSLNYALLISNMYQDDLTQEIAHQLMRFTLYAHQEQTEQQSSLIYLYTKQLQQVLIHPQYQPAFYGPRTDIDHYTKYTYDVALPEDQAQEFDYRNEARNQSIQLLYQQHPFKADQSACVAAWLESYGYNSWQAQHLQATPLQAVLYKMVYELIDNYYQYDTQKNTENSINTLALLLLDASISAIRWERFTQACLLYDASFALLAHTKAVDEHCTHINTTHTPIAELIYRTTIPIHEIYYFASNYQTNHLQQCTSTLQACLQNMLPISIYGYNHKNLSSALIEQLEELFATQVQHHGHNSFSLLSFAHHNLSMLKSSMALTHILTKHLNAYMHKVPQEIYTQHACVQHIISTIIEHPTRYESNPALVKRWLYYAQYLYHTTRYLKKKIENNNQQTTYLSYDPVTNLLLKTIQ